MPWIACRYWACCSRACHLLLACAQRTASSKCKIAFEAPAIAKRASELTTAFTANVHLCPEIALVTSGTGDGGALPSAIVTVTVIEVTGVGGGSVPLLCLRSSQGHIIRASHIILAGFAAKWHDCGRPVSQQATQAVSHSISQSAAIGPSAAALYKSDKHPAVLPGSGRVEPASAESATAVSGQLCDWRRRRPTSYGKLGAIRFGVAPNDLARKLTRSPLLLLFSFLLLILFAAGWSSCKERVEKREMSGPREKGFVDYNSSGHNKSDGGWRACSFDFCKQTNK